jgi:hypothetical protein
MMLGTLFFPKKNMTASALPARSLYLFLHLLSYLRTCLLTLLTQYTAPVAIRLYTFRPVGVVDIQTALFPFGAWTFFFGFCGVCGVNVALRPLYKKLMNNKGFAERK